ncbi:MAG TPA: 50S ribosomal protein L35 [Kiritimatiellia bacterium]|mgnify:CR=1 FL=1|nr:50S ribosomal protein L35 [Kiritimatiellia bacterium]
MPKQKTKKSAAKRFKKTATGKLTHSRMGRRHLASSKSTKRKRHLRSEAVVSAAFTKQISAVIG